MRTGIPTLVQVVHSSLRLSLPFVSSIHVSDEVVSNVVANLYVGNESVRQKRLRK